MTQTITVGHLRLEILNDECPPNPRTEQDNLGKMVLYHRRYDLPNELDIPVDSDSWSSWEELYTILEKDYKCPVVLPVYMLDHSGVWLRCGGFGDVDPGGWDSGQVGFIVATKKDILNNFTGWNGSTRMPMKKRISKKMIDTTTKILQGEVQTYGAYINGEVYWFKLYDLKRAIAAGGIDVVPDAHIDSCSGFYSVEDMIGSVPEQFNERLAKHDFD